MTKTCTVVEKGIVCGKPHVARGYCRTHYVRWWKHGDPLHNEHPGWPENLLQNLDPQPDGCIYFTGALSSHGYGQLWIEDTSQRAHIAAYELFVGPIPEGMQIDHLCHNADLTCAGGDGCLHRRCVNVDHLEPKSHRDNCLASHSNPSAIHAAKTHCIRGHEFDEENTYHRPEGGRRCRACRRMRGN